MLAILRWTSVVGKPIRSGELLGGKYRLREVIGTGGMGIVYDALHTDLKIPCAVKVVGGRRDDGALSKRLLREARVLARLSSPHSVRVLDVGRLPNGSPYLVMERLFGEPLRALLQRDGKLPIATAVWFARQICDAIQEAHAHGVVHRDLKPSNVFVLAGERIKVLDFGLALHLHAVAQDSTATASEFAGSPRYMSPEQIRASAEVNASTDLWSLGVLLFEMLTGRLPFDGPNAGAILASIVADPATRLRELRPDAPHELDQLVADLLEKHPRDRPHDAAQLKQRLDALTALSCAAPPLTAAATPGASRHEETEATDVRVEAAPPPIRRALRAWPALLVAALLSPIALRVLLRNDEPAAGRVAAPQPSAKRSDSTLRSSPAQAPVAATAVARDPKELRPSDPTREQRRPSRRAATHHPSSPATSQPMSPQDVLHAISTRH